MNAPSVGKMPKVAILMATFGNARFLPGQLSSIFSQTYENFDIWISKDCETEAVGAVLEEYASASGSVRFSILNGPRKGAAENFLSLISNPEIQADYFAYSDQDDIWDKDKLSRAVASLDPITEIGPVLYGSRSYLIDKDGNALGKTPLPRKPIGFRNALVQNVAAGHTMVMNRTARDILRNVGIKNVPFHDWWTYLIVMGAGGRMIYDSRPSVRYRQHDTNLTGIPLKRMSGFFQRMRRIFRCDFRRDVIANIYALQKAKDQLTQENLLTLNICKEALEKPLLRKLWGLRKSRVYRQTRIEDFCLYAAAIFGKF